MKTFKDLVFKPHLSGSGLMSRLHFDNGYGVSVVRFKRDSLGAGSIVRDLALLLNGETEAMDSGYGSYTDNENEWELAVLKDNVICYDTYLTKDVLGHLSNEQVTDIIKRVQEL